MSAISAKLNNNFANPARQAAKAFGVNLTLEASRNPRWKAGAVYGALKWKAEACALDDSRILIVSADDRRLSAVIVGELQEAFPYYLELNDMLSLCSRHGVLDDAGLIEEYKEERKFERERAAYGY